MRGEGGVESFFFQKKFQKKVERRCGGGVVRHLQEVEGEESRRQATSLTLPPPHPEHCTGAINLEKVNLIIK